MAAKRRKKTGAKPTAAKAVPKKRAPNQLLSLARLTALELVGFIVLEIILWLLVLTEIIPANIVIKRVGIVEVSMNTGYLALVGLVAVLVASFWLAILVTFGLAKLEEVEFSF